MKKILLGLLFTAISLMAADGKALAGKCAACHGANFEKAALGKAAIVNAQSSSDIYDKLTAYKEGTRNTVGMGALMTAQVASMSYNDILEVANYIATLSEEAAPAVEAAATANDWPYVCEQPDIAHFGGKRYFSVASSDANPWIAADTKTIQIDRKNKTIKVWSVWLASPDEQQQDIQKYGSQYSEYGYMKRLDTIKYSSMMVKVDTLVEYQCNGNVISSNTYNNSQWSRIIPESVMEGMMQSIMKKYNLK